VYKASPRTKTSTDPRYRVFRGGGWDDRDAAWVRAAYLGTVAPANRYNSLGFRCAQRGARMTLKVTQ
jgi:formylglycine-generating enzyme required for sulfatase activity